MKFLGPSGGTWEFFGCRLVLVLEQRVCLRVSHRLKWELGRPGQGGYHIVMRDMGSALGPGESLWGILVWIGLL